MRFDGAAVLCSADEVMACHCGPSEWPLSGVRVRVRFVSLVSLAGVGAVLAVGLALATGAGAVVDNSALSDMRWLDQPSKAEPDG